MLVCEPLAHVDSRNPESFRESGISMRVFAESRFDLPKRKERFSPRRVAEGTGRAGMTEKKDEFIKNFP